MIKRKFVFAHMKVASVYAELSTCKRLKVGAVIVKGDTPIAIGYNGTKPGQDNCCEDTQGKTKQGVRHAEINALNKLWTSRESAQDAVIFQTHSPCLDCAQDLYNAGIKEVYYRWDYRNDDGIYWLLDKGVSVYKVLPDIDTINRLSLRYNNQVDPYREIAYDKITETKEINEEAAELAGYMGQHLEPEVSTVRREIQTIWQFTDQIPVTGDHGFVSFIHAGNR